MSTEPLPEGWDHARVGRVRKHYESQSEENAVAEDETSFESVTQTTMTIPVELVPAVRDLIAKARRTG